MRLGVCSAVLVAGVMVAQTVPGVPIAEAQTADTARVMRQKMAHAEQVLRAIMTSDLASLERESAALSALTRAEGWQVLRSPEYLRQSAAFVQAMADLSGAATQRDPDAAIVAYSGMTLRCYQCHRYLKGVRLAVDIRSPASRMADTDAISSKQATTRLELDRRGRAGLAQSR